ncbi:RtcB family protein [Candidatus Woesearchaeota archaeon]|nr:MAG: RtcB family protein [Candidatus Woesearchaeota archaeon]
MINRNIPLPHFEKKSPNIWDIPTSYKEGMRVPARIFASEELLKDMDLAVFDQLTNVACLPGITTPALCMPDGHSGYGFPIGGVAAFDVNSGVISPGGIGFDINCGMRLVTTNLTLKEVRPKLHKLVDLLFERVPSGVGGHGFVKIEKSQFKDVMREGARWCIDNGYGWDEDLNRIEDFGRIEHADANLVSDKAISRGFNQLGTLGSGNHYLEIQHAADIFDAKTAAKFGIHSPDQICVMVHCGSRGFGHQIATDYLKVFHDVMKREGIAVRDPELSCAPFSSKEGQNYFKAMACAANMAFANRQVILHRIRECFKTVFEQSPEKMEMNLVYDVAHNIAKLEEHNVDGKKKKLLVHRKGATRCFGPGRQELAPALRKIGQPVIIGGSMETGSYLLLGTEKALEETFGSTAHGSGRTMSRTQARGEVRGEQLQKDLEKKGIYVRTASYSGLAEEAGFAYKPISSVVDTMHEAGISKKIVGFKPIGNIKG